MLTLPEGQIELKVLFPIEVGEWLLRQPECKLWAVCLTQAVASCVGLRANDFRRHRHLDRYWLFRDQRNCVGSCNWICDLLELDRKRLISFVYRNRHVLAGHPYRMRVFH
jgi:hypothetical protein